MIDALTPGLPALTIRSWPDGNTRSLRVPLVSIARPQWRGESIVVAGFARDGQAGLYTIDQQTGDARLLLGARELETSFEGAWARGGRVHYNRFQDWRRGIFSLDLDTGRRRVLYTPLQGTDIGLENLALSPDGNTLAFHARQMNAGTASLMLMPAAGGPARPLLSVRAPDRFLYGAFAWTPDSRALLVVVAHGASTEIRRIDAATGASQTLASPNLQPVCFRLSPNGRTAVFHAGSPKEEIWVMENFLR